MLRERPGGGYEVTREGRDERLGFTFPSKYKS
jgi:hypothetical protein